MERTIHSLEELGAEAKSFVGRLSPHSDRATVVALSGELGAGKTAFSQAIAKSLGVSGHVTSPTFVLMKTYPLTSASLFRQLVHIDAYRLTSGKELEALEFDSILSSSKSLVLIEWPEQVSDVLPHPDHVVRIEVLPDNTRTITYG